MNPIHPAIKAIRAVKWSGDPASSCAPVRFECHVEIGEAGVAGVEGVDYFNLTVVNPAWAQVHLEATPETSPVWLAPRATLQLDTPSFQGIADCVAVEIAAMGPYPTWPEFARRLGPYLRWNLEGVPYPPFIS